MTIRTSTPESTIKRLRKLRALPSAAKASLYADNLCGIAVAVQLANDVHVYGVWEALLYVENYEADGYYKPGAAKRAMASLIKKSEAATVRIEAGT